MGCAGRAYLGGFVRSFTISEVAVAALAHRLAAPTDRAAPHAPLPGPPGPPRALVACAGGRPSSPWGGCAAGEGKRS